MAHDDTHSAMARKILKKIIDLVRLSEFINSVYFNATTLKLAEKVEHTFSHLFIFCSVFPQGHGFDAVTVEIY